MTPLCKTARSSMASMKSGRLSTARRLRVARTGQTMLNVTDSKIIRLFVDDEPFGAAGTNIRHYDRRLNLKDGTLDRELHWETPSGKLVRIRTPRLVSFGTAMWRLFRMKLQF